MELKREQRAEIFDKTVAVVTERYFDPRFNGTDWPVLANARREAILDVTDTDQFELAMHDMIRSLRTSHTGFFHQSTRRVPGRLAIAATFRRMETPGGLRWMVQDVHEGGPAHIAGLEPLDALEAIDGKQFIPPEQPMFAMGAISNLCVTRRGATIELALTIPAPRSRKQPYAEPKAVLASTLSSSVGYLKVAVFPGLIGIDVARDIDRAVAGLAECDRLILDLRGHLGGGLGVLRLMSYLTPGKLPIGYTLSRQRAESGYEKEKLPILDRLPSSKLFGIASLALKYAGRDPSVLLVSEGLGPQKWHGRVAIIVNEHTVSAGEMICAFARENNLAMLVGTETAGRLIPGSGFNVGYGYLLIMPKAAYITWQGNRYEGRGIAPDVLVPWSPSDWTSGRDNQIEEASKLVANM